MARILHNNEWFEEINSRGHYEHEFETILQQESASLFANYYLVPFKTTVYSEEDGEARVADFALIHKCYKSWWVVEVELGHHSFDAHVLPQVRTLARAKYGRAEAEYLCNRKSTLDKVKIIEMFKGDSPGVLVVVNSPVEGWADQLRPFGAKVVICQIFRSRLNRHMLRLNGEYPSENEEIVTTCECTIIHRLLEIHSPTQLHLQKGERMVLFYEGQASEWERIDTADCVFLHSVRDHNLKSRKQYEIILQGDGTFAIRLVSSRRN